MLLIEDTNKLVNHVIEVEQCVQMPAGLLYANLIEAQNVPNMDWLSKTDAYVKVFICGRRNRFTRVIWNSLNPRQAPAPIPLPGLLITKTKSSRMLHSGKGLENTHSEGNCWLAAQME